MGKNRLNIKKVIAVVVAFIILICAIFYGVKAVKNRNSADTGAWAPKQQTQLSKVDEAKKLAMGYDYDGAIELLKSQSDYEKNEEYKKAVAEFEAQKAECVPVDVEKVPHIFYHSLVNEPQKTFDVETLGEAYANGHQTWMVTVSEFDKITQSLYDNGYVYVRLRDLVVETKNEDGTVTFKKNDKLMLPKGKKAIVLSIDDLSYYHTYEKGGYPTKVVVDENGKPKCEFTNSKGETSIGDYDVVPRLNTFLEQHPDGAYKGARGLIAMTGYNGVFGYRTDVAYKTGEKLGSDQKKWLSEHPDFNWEKEVEEAKKVAAAIKESGWEFASHTWGHVSVTGKSAETLKIDNEKWMNTVGNIVGKTDTIIFAHGNDIGNWKDYSSDNAVFNYYKSAGYNFYCNVDSSKQAWNQFRSNYVRQARIDIDGLMLNKAIEGKTKVFEGMFDPKAVYDSQRPAFKAVTGKL